MKEKKITIIGGYGGTGKFFAELFSKKGNDVTITGPDESKGRKAAEELGIGYEKDNVKASVDADVVVISVPIDATEAVIKEVAPHAKKGSLLMDVTSLKEMPCKAMKEYAPKDVEIIGTHPMFSHRVGSIEGQVVILTPVRGKKWLTWLRKNLAENKARVYETTPEEHDRTMAVVQGLTHFAYISLGKTLQELDFDIKNSRNYSSPIYELMLDIIGRIVGQSPELYASIQMNNPRIKEVHKRFIEVAEKLQKAAEKKDAKHFREMMLSSAKHFGDVERAMGRSDKAISSLVSELSALKESVGKEVCTKHIYSGQTHVGRVKSVNPEEVVLEDAGKESKLKLANIRIMGDEERLRCKKEKYGLAGRDYSVVLEAGVDEKLLCSLLRGFDENVFKAEVKDVYSGPQVGAGKKSVCFHLELINNDAKKTEGKIEKFFSGIGGRLR